MADNKPGNSTLKKKPAGHGAGSDRDELPVVPESTSQPRSSTSHSRGKGGKHERTLAIVPEQPKEFQKTEEGQSSIGKATQQETKESSPPKITKDRVDITLKRVDEVVKVYDNEVDALKKQIQELKDKINLLATNAKGLRAKQKKWEEKKSGIGTIAFIFETQKGNRSTEREQKSIEKGYGSIEKDLDNVANELGHAFSAQYQ